MTPSDLAQDLAMGTSEALLDHQKAVRSCEMCIFRQLWGIFKDFELFLAIFDHFLHLGEPIYHKLSRKVFWYDGLNLEV